ncbi:hypothetical protein Q7P37_008100 [Cladosporium fusiforme]
MKRTSSDDSEQHRKRLRRGHTFQEASTADAPRPASGDSRTGTSTPHQVQNARVECKQCGKLLKSSKTLKQHEKLKHGVKASFRCSDCGEELPRRDNLLRHARKHTQEGYKTCLGCGHTCRADYLGKHLLTKGACRKIYEETGSKVESAISEQQVASLFDLHQLNIADNDDDGFHADYESDDAETSSVSCAFVDGDNYTHVIDTDPDDANPELTSFEPWYPSNAFLGLEDLLHGLGAWADDGVDDPLYGMGAWADDKIQPGIYPQIAEVYWENEDEAVQQKNSKHAAYSIRRDAQNLGIFSTGERISDLALYNISTLPLRASNYMAQAFPLRVWKCAEFTCKICGTSANSTSDQILSHAQECARSPSPLHTCDECGITFIFKNDWQNHCRQPGYGECIAKTDHLDLDIGFDRILKAENDRFKQDKQAWEDAQLFHFKRAALFEVFDHMSLSMFGAKSMPIMSGSKNLMFRRTQLDLW